MYKLRWTNIKTNKSDLARTEKGVRTYKTEKAALNAIKKFEQNAPAEIKYEIVK